MFFFFFLMSFLLPLQQNIKSCQNSKAMQTIAIGTVAKSLPQNKVILLNLLISIAIFFIQIYAKSLEYPRKKRGVAFINIMNCLEAGKKPGTSENLYRFFYNFV